MLNLLLIKILNEYKRIKNKLIRTKYPNVYVYNEIPFGILPRSTRLGHGGLGIVINSGAKIGNNVFIGQNVTIGGKYGERPIIEDHVNIYANSCVIGGIKIGHHSKIAPGAMVYKNIPPYSLVVGYSRIFKNKYKPNSKTIKLEKEKKYVLPSEKILDSMPRRELKRIIYDLAAENNNLD